MTKLSIVTICFNDLEGLKKTILSLSLQSSHQFEQVIVDGGSSDGTRQFLESLQVPWSLKWISEKDRGIYDAMNKGARLATSEYIWYLNSADYAADPEVLKDVLDCLDQNQGIDLLYGNLFFENKFGRRLVGKKATESDFFIEMPCLHPATIFKTQLILANPYRTDYKIISDWILLRRIFEESSSEKPFKTLYFNRTLSVFDMEGVSSTNLWKILSEKLRYETVLINRMKLILKSGFKYAILSLLNELQLLSFVRKLRHRNLSR